MQAARFRLCGQEAASSSGRKNQKTFAPLRDVVARPLRFAMSLQGHWPKMIKVFLLLFVHKKKCLLFSRKMAEGAALFCPTMRGL
jgi:hypothetical protein